jgi:predicted DNA-binding transcriptional regulator YafY
MPIARMRLIYEAIKAERRPNCSLLSRKLEVSAKTVQRDIDYMRYQLNLPIEYDQENHGFFFAEPVTHFPSVHITESELVALLVARKAVEQYADTPFQKPLAAAFQKLSAGLDGQISFNWQELEQTFEFRPFGVSKQNLAVFETIAAALREAHELELKYRKLEAQRSELRRVQPYSVVCIENQWYLRAWDLVRRDLRTFHLRRITQARKLPHRFKRPAGFDVNESLVDSIGIYVGTEPEKVVLRFSGWAATVVSERSWHPSQSIRKQGDGSLELKLKVGYQPRIRTLALVLGRRDRGDVPWGVAGQNSSITPKGCCSQPISRLLRATPEGVAVLNRPGRVLTQCVLRLQGPIRFPQHLASNEDQVCVSACNDLVGVSGFGDEPDSTSSDIGLLPDAPGKRHLVSFRYRNASVRNHSS